MDRWPGMLLTKESAIETVTFLNWTTRKIADPESTPERRKDDL